MMSRLRRKPPGIKVCVRINSYLGDASPYSPKPQSKATSSSARTATSSKGPLANRHGPGRLHQLRRLRMVHFKALQERYGDDQAVLFARTERSAPPAMGWQLRVHLRGHGGVGPWQTLPKNQRVLLLERGHWRIRMQPQTRPLQALGRAQTPLLSQRASRQQLLLWGVLRCAAHICAVLTPRRPPFPVFLSPCALCSSSSPDNPTA